MKEETKQVIAKGLKNLGFEIINLIGCKVAEISKEAAQKESQNSPQSNITLTGTNNNENKLI